MHISIFIGGRKCHLKELNLRKNPDIVIKPYDKGRDICIMNRSDYLQVGYKHLESEHYTELDQDITQETILLVHNVLTEMRNKNHIDKHTLAYLDPSSQTCHVPTMYFLPSSEYTIRNVETTTALFRANTSYMVVPASVLVIVTSYYPQHVKLQTSSIW